MEMEMEMGWLCGWLLGRCALEGLDIDGMEGGGEANINDRDRIDEHLRTRPAELAASPLFRSHHYRSAAAFHLTYSFLHQTYALPYLLLHTASAFLPNQVLSVVFALRLDFGRKERSTMLMDGDGGRRVWGVVR